MRRAAPPLVLLIATAAAQDGAAIGSLLAELVATPSLAGARIGVEVQDLGSGAVLAAHDADRGFLPASNMKLISAAVAMKTLGGEFSYATRVVAAAPPVDGTIAGDVFLVGDGDPSIGGRPRTDATPEMDRLAAQLAERGVRRIRGRVLGCGSTGCREPYGRGWQWDYLDEDYAAPCADLNFAENTVELFVRGGDGAPTVREVPLAGALTLALDLASVPGTAGQLRAVRRFGEHRVSVWGRVGSDEQSVRVAVEVPERYAAQALVAALQASGIAVQGGADAAALVGETLPPAPTQLAECRSPTLATLLRPMLKHSINLYAEQFWRTAGHRGAGAIDSGACEVHAVAVLRQLGVPTAGLVLADGSGLSRRNLVQPRQLTALLRAIHADPGLAAILPSLPVAGVDGTIAARLRGPATQDHVRAKTGFVSYVACLSGYLDRPRGRAPLAFSVLLNNFTCDTQAAKAAIDTFVEQLARASGWSQR